MDLKQEGYEECGLGSSSAKAHERDLVNMVINRRPLTVFCAIDAFGSTVKPTALSQKNVVPIISYTFWEIRVLYTTKCILVSLS
jgi:hypothetical protein